MLPSEWHVFGPVAKDLVLSKAMLAAIPDSIEDDGKKMLPQKAVITNGNLDFAPFLNGATALRSAYVFIPFDLDHDREIDFGFGADFWFAAYLDGELFCDNLETGNWNHPPTATDYIESMMLSKGKHLLAIRFVSGSGSSQLCAAVFHGQKSVGMRSRKFHVDFSRFHGQIRSRLHGANHGPLCFSGAFDFVDEHRTSGFSNVRVNESPGSVPETVDVHAIFPLFHVEANDPRNYRFRPTDDYLKSILDAGERIYYRLGESTVHGFHDITDCHKFAEICVNIIRHYNDGWADGFHHGIEYWEIGNGNNFELYEVTARAIKKYNPRFKVGGGGISGSDVDGLEFIAYCSKNKVPFDFFSWHAQVCRPSEWIDHAIENRQRLDANGFQQTENHLNAWCYQPTTAMNGRSLNADERETMFARRSGAEGAAFNASSLILFHDAHLDMAHFSWALDGFLGWLDAFGVKTKAFYAFKAFHHMMEMSQRVVAVGGRAETGLAVLAGLSTDQGMARILFSNFQDPTKCTKVQIHYLPWKGRSSCQIRIVDKNHHLEVIQTEEHDGGDFIIQLKLPPATVVLVDIKQA